MWCLLIENVNSTYMYTGQLSTPSRKSEPLAPKPNSMFIRSNFEKYDILLESSKLSPDALCGTGPEAKNYSSFDYIIIAKAIFRKLRTSSAAFVHRHLRKKNL